VLTSQYWFIAQHLEVPSGSEVAIVVLQRRKGEEFVMHNEVQLVVTHLKDVRTMSDKGPYIVEAVRVLSDILRRMKDHQVKKRPLLRRLHVADDLIRVDFSS